MGYDCGDSYPFDFQLNWFPFGSKSKGELSPRSYPIQCERKWKYSFLGVVSLTFMTVISIYDPLRTSAMPGVQYNKALFPYMCDSISSCLWHVFSQICAIPAP